MLVKVAFVVLLPLGLKEGLNDHILAVGDVLLQLVAHHALDRLVLVGLGDLLNSVCDGVGLGAKLAQSEGGFEAQASSLKRVGLATSDCVVLGGFTTSV